MVRRRIDLKNQIRCKKCDYDEKRFIKGKKPKQKITKKKIKRQFRKVKK